MADGIFDVAFIGGGAIGSAGACQLSRTDAKARIVVFNIPGVNAHGSSPLQTSEGSQPFNDTRLNRFANAEEDGLQTEMVMGTQHYWRKAADEAEAAFGKRPHLYDDIGIAMMQTYGADVQNKIPIRGTSDFIGSTIKAAQAYNAANPKNPIAFETYHDPHSFARDYPQLPASSLAYVENSGILYSNACVNTQLALAKHRDATIINQQVTQVTAHNGQVEIRTADGGTYIAQKAMAAPGPFISRFAPDPEGREWVCAPQTLFYFALAAPQPFTDEGGCPAFVCVDSNGKHVYGMPIIEKAKDHGIVKAFKIAAEQYSRVYRRPEDMNGLMVKPEEIARMTKAVNILMGKGENIAHCIGYKTCAYTMTARPHPFGSDAKPHVDYGFNIDFDDSGRLLFVNACSGIGFKLSQYIAEQGLLSLQQGALTPGVERYNFKQRDAECEPSSPEPEPDLAKLLQQHYTRAMPSKPELK